MSVGVPSPDELAIVGRLAHVITQCCRGLDRRDERLVSDCFHVGADVPALESGSGPSQHVVTNLHVLGIHGDVAATETYWNLRRVDADGELVQSFGRYLDRFERRAGQWRIANRIAVTEWPPPSPGTEPVTDDDPSYALAAEVEPEGPHTGRPRVDGVVA